jgi:hypothetical protein
LGAAQLTIRLSRKKDENWFDVRSRSRLKMGHRR